MNQITWHRNGWYIHWKCILNKQVRNMSVEHDFFLFYYEIKLKSEHTSKWRSHPNNRFFKGKETNFCIKYQPISFIEVCRLFFVYVVLSVPPYNVWSKYLFINFNGRRYNICRKIITEKMFVFGYFTFRAKSFFAQWIYRGAFRASLISISSLYINAWQINIKCVHFATNIPKMEIGKWLIVM